MKERTEKQPVDELFARKLENMSLPPSPDGFARLQARMGQVQAAPRVVFWRNPSVQRYMAVAACLLLVCLFGWLYLTNEGTPTSQGTVAVTNPTGASKENPLAKPPVDGPAIDIAANQPVSEPAAQGQQSPVSGVSPLGSKEKAGKNAAEGENQAIASAKPPVPKAKKLEREVPAPEPVKPTEQLAKIDNSPVVADPAVEKQLAAASKPVPAAERVLVVTIAEPEALVAARRTAKAAAQEETVADADPKADKETKAGTLWSQVKRLKQGEIFARKDEGDEERGLIGRAYSGLKHSLDKDKPTKQ
jgi:hypothetical protein